MKKKDYFYYHKSFSLLDDFLKFVNYKCLDKNKHKNDILIITNILNLYIFK